MLRTDLVAKMRGPLVALCVTVLFGSWAGLANAAPADDGQRFALIIGNDDYSVRPLRNAVNDARAISRALQAASFRTTVKKNATLLSMRQAVPEFLGLIGPRDTALFYYAGHAVQIRNENFLIPVDFEKAESIIDAKFRFFSVTQLLEELKALRPARTIIILDSCRSNPVTDKYTLQAGLAQLPQAGKETFIAFSTSPNEVATDNPGGKNSWFTEALVNLISSERGLTIDTIFTDVSEEVKTATRERQIPWRISTFTEEFYFFAPGGDAPAATEVLWAKSLQHEKWENWTEAIELADKVASSQAERELKERARNKLAYLQPRRNADDLYEAGDYEEAAASYEEAFRLEPFVTEAGFQAVNSYLLSDKLPEALQVLRTIRIRGSSASISKANAMLGELAAIHQQAGDELKDLPDPPSIADLFAGTSFGVPKASAATPYLDRSPMQLAKWLENVTLISPPSVHSIAVTQTPESSVSPETTGSEIDIGDFHVEVDSDATRNAEILDFGENFGFILLNSEQADTVVLVDGERVSQRLPATLRVAAGHYTVRAVREGTAVSTTEVKVPPQGIIEVAVGGDYGQD